MVPYKVPNNTHYVRYEDYARLKAEVERLTKAGDEMEKVIWMAECIAGVEHTEKSSLAWNAAKEGNGQP